MSNIEINGTTLAITLGAIETDGESNWRNGNVTLGNGEVVPCGGGYVLSEEDADRYNDERGFAGHGVDGLYFPGGKLAGDFRPYEIGEDGSGWETQVMPEIYGDDVDDEKTEHVYDIIQTAMQKLADATN